MSLIKELLTFLISKKKISINTYSNSYIHIWIITYTCSRFGLCTFYIYPLLKTKTLNTLCIKR